jgi:acyl transferase domain-containing protein
MASSFTGGWLNAAMLKSGHYWADQMRQTVRWQDGASKLIGHSSPDVVLEMGPGNSLSHLTSLCIPEGVDDPTFLQAMVHPSKGSALDVEMLTQTLRQLADMGIDIDWGALDLPQSCTTLSAEALAEHLDSCCEAEFARHPDSVCESTHDGGSTNASPAASFQTDNEADVASVSLGWGWYEMLFGQAVTNDSNVRVA